MVRARNGGKRRAEEAVVVVVGGHKRREQERGVGTASGGHGCFGRDLATTTAATSPRRAPLSERRPPHPPRLPPPAGANPQARAAADGHQEATGGRARRAQRRDGLASGGMSAGRGRQMRIRAQPSSPRRRHRFMRGGGCCCGCGGGWRADPFVESIAQRNEFTPSGLLLLRCASRSLTETSVDCTENSVLVQVGAVAVWPLGSSTVDRCSLTGSCAPAYKSRHEQKTRKAVLRVTVTDHPRLPHSQTRLRGTSRLEPLCHQVFDRETQPAAATARGTTAAATAVPPRPTRYKKRKASSERQAATASHPSRATCGAVNGREAPAPVTAAERHICAGAAGGP